MRAFFPLRSACCIPAACSRKIFFVIMGACGAPTAWSMASCLGHRFAWDAARGSPYLPQRCRAGASVCCRLVVYYD